MSFTVTVTVVVLVPLAVTMPGATPTLEVAVAGAPATNVTVAVGAREPTVAVNALIWAVVEASVAVNTPEALVVPEAAGPKVLALPELLKVTP